MYLLFELSTTDGVLEQERLIIDQAKKTRNCVQNINYIKTYKALV